MAAQKSRANALLNRFSELHPILSLIQRALMKSLAFSGAVVNMRGEAEMNARRLRPIATVEMERAISFFVNSIVLLHINIFLLPQTFWGLSSAPQLHVP